MNINFLPKDLLRKNKLSPKMQATLLLLFLGAASLGLIQENVEIIGGTNLLKSFAQAEDSAVKSNMTEIIYGQNYNAAEAEAMLDKQVKFMSTRQAFLPSLEVVKKHEQAIRSEAQRMGVPEDVAIGIAFLENGGSENAVSSAGAAGIYQLMPRTMESMGYAASDRSDPKKSIAAGLKYLSQNFQIFGDWGLTTWSYHAGEGNVAKALRVFARAHDGLELPGFENTAAWRNYIASKNINVNKLLSDASVQRQVTSRLNDDSAGYPYKVMATSHLFELEKELGMPQFLQRITMLNTDIIKIADLF